MKVLVVVDMQNDFITGSLGSQQAVSIVPNVVEKVKNFDGQIIFTKDTHFSGYLTTQEGKNLPVEHCVKGTLGWEICDELKPYANKVIEKITFDDHHGYSFRDIKDIDGIIVTTEKDAVKLAKYDTDNIYALRLKTEFDVEALIN